MAQGKRSGKGSGSGGREPLFRAIESLQRLTELVERRRGQLAREAGLSDSQWRVLEEIGREDFMPSLFARDRETHRAAVSRVLRQLQDNGLVVAEIAAGDARQREYTLTGKGKRLLGQLRRSRERAIDAVWEGLPRAELDRFARFSGELADRLERYASSADR